MNEVLAQIARIGVVPIVVIDRPEQAVPLAEALIRGGLPCVEITLRTPAALESVRRIAAAFPDMLTGAGTVLSVEQAQAAADAGARFLVTPGFDPDLVDWCLARALPILPGVATPTEITLALKKGVRVLKFFPADVIGGPAAIRTMAGPFPDVRFVPTGGITDKTLAEYVKLPAVLAGGGSWLVRRDLIDDGRFDEITQLAAGAIAIVQAARGG